MKRIAIAAIVILSFVAVSALAAPTDSPVQRTIPAVHDIDPPTIEWMEIEPVSVNTSLSAQTMQFTARIRDNLSGHGISTFRYESSVAPDQFVDFTFQDRDRISGDHRDGIYRVHVRLPRYSALGGWEMAAGFVADAVGNTHRVTRSQARVRQRFANGPGTAMRDWVWMPAIRK